MILIFNILVTVNLCLSVFTFWVAVKSKPSGKTWVGGGGGSRTRGYGPDKQLRTGQEVTDRTNSYGRDILKLINRNGSQQIVELCPTTHSIQSSSQVLSI